MTLIDFPEKMPIARYRLVFRITRDLHLPPYAGSTLRGVFGHALLDTVCTCGERGKHDPNCPYSAIFTAPENADLSQSQQNTPPQPYVFETIFNDKTLYKTGENYVFHLVLFGQTRLLLPLIISALKQAFASRKLNGAGELIELSVQNGADWQNIQAGGFILPHNNHLILQENIWQNGKLLFKTPLRMQQKSQIIRAKQITPEMILRQTMRRVSTIAKLYFDAPLSADYTALSALAQTVQGECRFAWHDWQRYSNRQQQRMKLGGALGECVLRDVPREFAMLLNLGEFLHIGKETVFGLGGYEIQAI